MLALLVVPTAAGAWSAAGSGGAAGRAASMPTGPTPVAVAIVSTITVSWSGSTVAGAAVAGYVVKRYDAVSGVEAAVGGTCAGVVAGTTCSDTSVPLGVWRYSVTPAHHTWTGAEGSRSLAVAVTL